MTAHYPITQVLPQWTPQTEEMGSKPKFWYIQPEPQETYWLFKHPRPDRGEHWAEKIAAEIAALMSIDCARVELAEYQNQRGSTTKSITGHNQELIHGNQVMNITLAVDNIREWNFHAFDTPNDSDKAKQQLAEYLVLDAVIGNTDRHSENWGILKGQDRFERLSPSYDHGSSLGRELMDARRNLFLSDRRIGIYVERGRGNIHWRNTERRGPSPLELTRLAATQYPDLFRPALARLDNLDESSLRQIVDVIPESWMTPTARTFAFELMKYSRAQLQEVI